MGQQFNFFNARVDEQQRSDILEGFRYQREIISASEETELVEHISRLPLKEFDFHGYKGKRRVISFGWRYEFSGGGKLIQADDIPEFLLSLRLRVASFANLRPEALQHVLCTEYRAGAGIGWHKDRSVFGEVVGVSLLSRCVLRFRRKIEVKPRKMDEKKNKKRAGTRVIPVTMKWERFNVLAEPRSAYMLTGPARVEWQHSILRVDSLRYSITFRSMREEEISAGYTDYTEEI